MRFRHRGSDCLVKADPYANFRSRLVRRLIASQVSTYGEQGESLPLGCSWMCLSVTTPICCFRNVPGVSVEIAGRATRVVSFSSFRSKRIEPTGRNDHQTRLDQRLIGQVRGVMDVIRLILADDSRLYLRQGELAYPLEELSPDEFRNASLRSMSRACRSGKARPANLARRG